MEQVSCNENAGERQTFFKSKLAPPPVRAGRKSTNLRKVRPPPPVRAGREVQRLSKIETLKYLQ